jgi:addiction module HigA family antidote
MNHTFEISHPGEHLKLDFLQPLGISGYQLAKALQLPKQAIYDILAGKRSISAEVSLLLDCYFGMSEGFFHRLQNHYDRIIARRQMGKRLQQVVPHSLTLHP